jgi:hypothetical protein
MADGPGGPAPVAPVQKSLSFATVWTVNVAARVVELLADKPKLSRLSEGRRYITFVPATQDRRLQAIFLSKLTGSFSS